MGELPVLQYGGAMDRYLRHPSFAARWSGTDLAPVQSSVSADAEIWAGWTENGEAIWEAFNATMIDEDAAIIRAVPAYAYGLNFGDKVSVIASAEGPLVINDISARGDQTTFRIWLGADPDPSLWRRVAESYAQSGCVIDVLSARLIALSCAASDSTTIQNKLQEDEAATRISWEPGTPFAD
jgi:hypothetical protein